jgi:hypothetical protein
MKCYSRMDRLDVELVNVVLWCIPRSWEPYMHGICARETLVGFDRIWNDCIQEETWLVYKEDMDSILKSISDENQALIARMKGKKRFSR